MSFLMLSCLTIFLALFAASVVLQWFRAMKRKKLVASVNPVKLDAEDQASWRSIENSLDFMFKDFRKLQIIKRNGERFGSRFQSKLTGYRRFSRIEMAVTFSMLVFGLTAFLFC